MREISPRSPPVKRVAMANSRPSRSISGCRPIIPRSTAATVASSASIDSTAAVSVLARRRPPSSMSSSTARCASSAASRSADNPVGTSRASSSTTNAVVPALQHVWASCNACHSATVPLPISAGSSRASACPRSSRRGVALMAIRTLCAPLRARIGSVIEWPP